MMGGIAESGDLQQSLVGCWIFVGAQHAAPLPRQVCPCNYSKTAISHNVYCRDFAPNFILERGRLWLCRHQAGLAFLVIEGFIYINTMIVVLI